MSTGLTNLPLEIRQQIFGEYFRVPGGYVYDGKSDKLRNADGTPIDLSLIYTCRSIANDCKHLPLAVNTLHFSTLYREDWRSLAGCFNLAATYYNVLQQDLVIHLADHITPEMHAELATEFPGFKAKLDAEREYHFHIWRTGDGPRLAGENMRPTPCQFVQDFYGEQVAAIRDKSLYEYHGPIEFSNRIHASLPHWVNKYPAEEFFNLRFDDWAIPTRAQVEHVIRRLGIPDFVWKLPDMWMYNIAFHNAVGDNPSSGQFSEQYDNPTLDFKFRLREKIRFSAVAAAIRFLGLLPPHQRTQIRTLDLYEDLDSVNKPSLHGHGLVPLLQENPLLQVQRRVSVVNCIMNACPDVSDIDTLLMPRWGGGPCGVDPKGFAQELSVWLLDSLVVADAGISTEWYSLFLDSDAYTDECTEGFDKVVHYRIALHHAWNGCLESGLLTDLSGGQVKRMSREYALEDGYENAIMQLVHQTSSVLRCGFSPGLPKDHQWIIDGMKANEEGVWNYWDWGLYWDQDKDIFTRPHSVKDGEAVARLADIQSQEEYLQSQR
ncbi:hypothetical protein LB507_007649 [Fusarium sp. FIESC RH6]|nr:hypothetical protein LB507_007649 [Fusarium sp. FIESC RH6]